MQVIITRMEEYRNKVSNLHAIQSQIISKFTGDISKNTSKSTSETDQIRLGGGHGGAYPSSRASPRLYVAPIPGVRQTVGGEARPWVCQLRPMRLMRLYETHEAHGDSRRGINGYPFTTFDIFPDFLGRRF